MASLTRVHPVALAPADQRLTSRPSPAPRTATSSASACASSSRRRRTVEVGAVGAHQAQRDGTCPRAHAANLGRHAGKLHRPGSTCGCAGGTSSSGSPRPRSSKRCAARRPHPASTARDHAAPLETTTNDRSRLVALGVKPHSAWRAVYAGRSPTWALSHAPAVDHGLRNRVLRRARADLGWPICTATDAPPSSPLSIQHGPGAGIDRGRNRPTAGFTTRRPEEPCANSASTVLWEPGRATAPATRQRRSTRCVRG